ncbi:MAG: NAD(P)/FAD-dependent oxidoreductase, partial [Gracilibacteraceae bacterium]|nr:NAD(P)/FAD-dependent oxidoreductase [Gracilibacteraceae bacterium]
MDRKRIVVVGGGAAGLMAAGTAARAAPQAEVLLLEKGDKLARKLLLSGKGRCNITHDGEISDFIEAYPGNGKFLHSALRLFDNETLREFFREQGVPTKVERGGRVFPINDRAESVAQALIGFIRDQGVGIHLNQHIGAIRLHKPGCLPEGTGEGAGSATTRTAVAGVAARDRFWPADAVIIAVGGASYPGTGSTGDGYVMARAVGHGVVPARTALVPLKTAESWPAKVQGLSLRNVRLSLWIEGVKKQDQFGEMLFTHYGVSGPIVLTLSRMAAQALGKGSTVGLTLNLKPALSQDVLIERLKRDWGKMGARQFKNALGDLLPKNLIPIIVELSGLDGAKQARQITAAETRRLTEMLQAVPMRVTGTLGLQTGIVTAGGIDIRSLDPKTMASKHIGGLYWAGEVVDVDGITGGYNLQAAFSMGCAAGQAA